MHVHKMNERPFYAKSAKRKLELSGDNADVLTESEKQNLLIAIDDQKAVLFALDKYFKDPDGKMHNRTSELIDLLDIARRDGYV